MATNRNPKIKKNVNVKKGEKGFQKTQPQAKTPKPTATTQQLPALNKKVAAPKTATTFDVMNEKIATQQRKALKQHSANAKLQQRRATLKTVRNKQTQVTKLKEALMEARDGTPQQRKAMEDIITQIVNKPGVRIRINWNS